MEFNCGSKNLVEMRYLYQLVSCGIEVLPEQGLSLRLVVMGYDSFSVNFTNATRCIETFLQECN